VKRVVKLKGNIGLQTPSMRRANPKPGSLPSSLDQMRSLGMSRDELAIFFNNHKSMVDAVFWGLRPLTIEEKATVKRVFLNRT